MRIVVLCIVMALLMSNAILMIRVHNLNEDVVWLKREVWDQGKALEFTQQHTPGIAHNSWTSSE